MNTFPRIHLEIFTYTLGTFRYIYVWKKIGGKWYIHNDCFNVIKPAQGFWVCQPLVNFSFLLILLLKQNFIELNNFILHTNQNIVLHYYVGILREITAYLQYTQIYTAWWRAINWHLESSFTNKALLLSRAAVSIFCTVSMRRPLENNRIPEFTAGFFP